ncbi:MAG: GNAT family N-acetyltransferase [Planctomycetes bacterium]|nr:GNAT family N-acetyltransferase [Planctomycetota bacterium]
MMEDLNFLPTPTLETKRLILRPLAMSDAEAILHYSQKPIFYQAMGRQTYSSASDIEEFIANILKKEPSFYWVVILRGKNCVIGDCGFCQFHKDARRAEICYAVDPVCWNHGYATEAAGRVIQFGFEEAGLDRIQAICSTGNSVSERVIQKSGMQFEGVLRHYIRHEDKPLDIKMYSILKQEWLERQTAL